RQVKNKVNSIQLLVCEVNPMPEKADYDWAHIDSSTLIPFATGVEGEPIEYNFRVDPHLLIAGASGGGKNFKLNSYLPVPVSERFPSGWAMNKELVEGDLVYTADGTTTRILGFSEIVTEPVYNVTFGDGQVVEVGGDHLWKVSSAASRAPRTPLKTTAREARELGRNTAAGQLRELAAEIGAGTVAPIDDISRLAGLHELSTYQMDLPIAELATIVDLPSKKKSKQFDMTPVAAWFGKSKSRTGGVISFAGKTLTIEEAGQLGLAGQWLTMREMTDTILGRSSTRKEREAAKQILGRLKPDSREGYTTFPTPVYPVDEVLTILAERLEYQAVRSDSGIQAPDLEAIVSTREMATMVIRRTEAREALNYAVRATAPIDGPDVELPVDPYVMGAWLGDGASRSGQFTSVDPEITDEIESAGYSLSHATDGPSHHIRGLKAELRATGVLMNKHIPAIYLRASYAQRLALLQGLMDTDGTINLVGASEIDLCHKPLADGVLELVRSLGILATQRAEPAKITEADPENPGQTRQRVTGTRYRLKFTTGLPIFRLPRKLERIPTELRGTQSWNYITDITVTDPEPMRCLKVEHPEHLYLTHGFIPTHNSVLLQSLAYGALVRGYELYIADPTKGGADFRFAEPYAMAFTATVFEAAAMMKGVYNEVVRRKNLNSAHGVGNYRDLPEDVRPKHMVLLLDEFTSLMGQDPVPAMSDDPEMDAERDMIIATNAARTQVGVYTGKVAREARSAGVTLFLATQKLSAKMLDTIPGAGDLKVNLSRLLLGKATYGDMQSALRAPQDAPVLGTSIPPGRGLFETTAGAAMAIQAWYNTAEQRILAENLGPRIPVLAEDEKLDLSPYMPKLPGHEAPPAPRKSAAKIVDLGELELDLGELELSLDDLDGFDEPAADVVTAAVAAAAPAFVREEIQDAAIFFDVDGTLCPFEHTPEMEKIIVPGHGTQAYRKAAIERLAALPLDQAWLTGWFEDAPDYLGHLFPRAIDVLNSDTEDTGLWKIDAVLAWLEDRPHIKRIVWIDDELLKVDDLLGISHRDIAQEAFEAAGIEALLVLTDSDDGVTDADVDRVEEFLFANSPAALAAESEAVDVPDEDSFDDWADAAAAVPESDEFDDWSTVAATVPVKAVPAEKAPQPSAPGSAPEPAMVPAGAPDLLDPFAEAAPPKNKRRRFNLPADEDPFG
ncbi:MAG TPA: HAD domain-containing protein, partial [Arthrobacter sp.]